MEPIEMVCAVCGSSTVAFLVYRASKGGVVEPTPRPACTAHLVTVVEGCERRAHIEPVP